MSLDLFVACQETTFRFHPATLRSRARERWSSAEVYEPGPRRVDTIEYDIQAMGADGTLEVEISVHRSRDLVGLECRTLDAAAEVLAWLGGLPGLPDDGGVVVIGWRATPYPLRPGITAAEVLADQQ